MRPTMGVGYEHLAQVLLERQRNREALQVLQEAHRRGVATPPALRQLGLLYTRAGEPGEAVAILETLAATEPHGGTPETLNALGVSLSDAGRHDEARHTLERVFQRDPHNPEARQNLALVALRQPDWAEAVRQARLALDDDPALPHAWNYLGVASYRLGRPREALEAWARAAELAPGDHDLLFNLGTVAAELGETERARPALERFVEQAPPERYALDIERARNLLRGLPG